MLIVLVDFVSLNLNHGKIISCPINGANKQDYV